MQVKRNLLAVRDSHDIHEPQLLIFVWDRAVRSRTMTHELYSCRELSALGQAGFSAQVLRGRRKGLMITVNTGEDYVDQA